MLGLILGFHAKPVLSAQLLSYTDSPSLLPSLKDCQYNLLLLVILCM